MSGIPITEENITKGGTNPPNESGARPPAPSGSGGVMAKIDEAEAGTIVVEKLVAAFEANPAAKAAFLKSVSEGLGLAPTVIAPAGMSYAPDLSNLDALKVKARDIITRTLNAHAVAVHRDVIYYLTDAIAEAFYVAPPVRPEDVQGVG